MLPNTKSLCWLSFKILAMGAGVALWFFIASLLLKWFGLPGGLAWNVFSALSFLICVNHWRKS
jgi:hypothetical protein